MFNVDVPVGEKHRTLLGGRCEFHNRPTDNFKIARHKELKVARCRWEIILPNGNYSHSSDMGDNRA